MASWMVHLRIADELLKHLDNVDETAFVNIMLQMNIDVDNAEAYDIVHRFINDRLIALMEYTILDEIDWRMAMRGELNEDSFDKTYDELVDINDLMMDIRKRRLTRNSLVYISSLRLRRIMCRNFRWSMCWPVS